MKTGYMVYVVGTNSPTKIHTTEEEAYTEAKRLCESNKREACVLKILGGYTPISQSERYEVQ